MKLDAIAEWLKNHDDYIVIAHINPDGDTIGSAIAMARMLRQLGKRAFACVQGGMTKLYAQFDGADELKSDTDAFPFEPKTALAVDVSEKYRMGEMEKRFDSCEENALIDHHATNAGFGTAQYIDGSATATGEILTALSQKLGLKLDKLTATWLFIALSTDCGNFNYSNTRATAFEAAAELMRAGIDISDLTTRLYRSRSEGRTRLLGRGLSDIHICANGKIAWARLYKSDFAKSNALPEDNEGIVNYLLEIDGVEMAFLAEERDNGTKFSLRSKRRLDVAKQIAVPLGGGGHARAAGVTLQMSMDEAVETVLSRAAAQIESI